MRCLLGLTMALAQPAAARLLAEESEEALAEEKVLFHYAIVVGIACLGVTFVVGHIMEVKGVHWMPEAAVGVLTGLLAAGLCKVSGQTQLLAHQQRQTTPGAWPVQCPARRLRLLGTRLAALGGLALAFSPGPRERPAN